MSQQYYTLLTTKGAELLANATALGVPLKLTHMAVGDGNGTIPQPVVTQTKLIHEVRRAPVNTLFIDKNNANQIIAEQVIPESEGGWFIHEIGLYDDKGNLIAVGNCPSSYKPKLAEGCGRTQVIRMILTVDNANAVQLNIDPAVVLASRAYVDECITIKMADHEKSTRHPDATTKSKGFVQLSSATNSDSEVLAATPKAIKTAYDLADSAVKKTGDTMSGNLVIKKNNTPTLELRDTRTSSFMRLFSHDYSCGWVVNSSGDEKTRLRFTFNTNTFNFENTNVTIDDKSVLKQGDGGLLSIGAALSNIDDKSFVSGFYNATMASTGSFPSSEPSKEGACIFVKRNSTKGSQLYLSSATSKIYYRGLQDNNFSEWKELITTANIDEYRLPAGTPIPYPTTAVPVGWLKCNGSAFDKTKYPKLAAVYPNGQLPDLRGEFIRGFDDGRGVDSSRGILSAQSDAIRNITGSINVTNSHTKQEVTTNGSFYVTSSYDGSQNGTAGKMWVSNVVFDASRVVPTANENRPRNVAFLYIVKAE